MGAAGIFCDSLFAFLNLGPHDEVLLLQHLGHDPLDFGFDGRVLRF
jgi:hypothetical protein